MGDSLPDGFYVAGGLVCLYLGLTFLGMVYTELRCRHWRVVSGVVSHRGVRQKRSISGDPGEPGYESLHQHDYIRVQAEVNGKDRSFEFSAHTEQVNDIVRLCVHPLFPQLFHCRYPDAVHGARRWVGYLKQGVVAISSMLLLGAAWGLLDSVLF
jgi:hypothetical protein